MLFDRKSGMLVVASCCERGEDMIKHRLAFRALFGGRNESGLVGGVTCTCYMTRPTWPVRGYCQAGDGSPVVAFSRGRNCEERPTPRGSDLKVEIGHRLEA